MIHMPVIIIQNMFILIHNVTHQSLFYGASSYKSGYHDTKCGFHHPCCGCHLLGCGYHTSYCYLWTTWRIIIQNIACHRIHHGYPNTKAGFHCYFRGYHDSCLVIIILSTAIIMSIWAINFALRWKISDIVILVMVFIIQAVDIIMYTAVTVSYTHLTLPTKA